MGVIFLTSFGLWYNDARTLLKPSLHFCLKFHSDDAQYIEQCYYFYDNFYDPKKHVSPPHPYTSYLLPSTKQHPTKIKHCIQTYETLQLYVSLGVMIFRCVTSSFYYCIRNHVCKK